MTFTAHGSFNATTGGIRLARRAGTRIARTTTGHTVTHARLRGTGKLLVHPVFGGKDVPVRKKAPPSRKLEAIATHAAAGVNGHGIHGTHGTQPNPQAFFPFTPPPFLGEGGEHFFRGGAEGQRCPLSHLPRNSRKNLFFFRPTRSGQDVRQAPCPADSPSRLLPNPQRS